MKKHSGYAPVGALKMYYEIHGSGGTPLVLLHGGGSTIQTTFGNILDSLAAHRQVIAVELQAHGHTADIGRPSTFEQDADDVAGLLDHLHISKSDVFGFSNGGSTALQLAIRHPDKVNKCVAVSAAFRRDGLIPGFFEGMQQATLDNMPEPLKAAYLQIDSNKDHLQIMFQRDRDRMIQFKDWPDDDLRGIKAHTLIVNADHDVITNQHAMKMAQLIPHATLMILPGVHGSFIGEVCTAVPGSKLPALTVAVVEEFLDRRSITPATPVDIPALTLLVNSAYRGGEGWTNESHLLDGARTDEAGIAELLSEAGAVILKYVDSDGILTGCVFLKKEEDTLYLGLLSVSPKIQGKGVGKALLAAADGYARENGCVCIRMTVISARHELVSWYERHGYKWTGKTDPFHAGEKFGIQKQPLELLVLEKPVAGD